MEKLQRNSGLLFRTIIYLLFYYFFLHAFLEEFKCQISFKTIEITAVIFIGFLALSAFHIQFLIKRWFEKGRFILYGTASILLLFIYAILANAFATLLLNNEPTENGNVLTLYRSGYFVFVGLIIIGLGLYFHFSDRWQMMRSKLAAFEKVKKESELIALKAQVHPHFLFNTLNSIYALSLEKSDAMPDSILKLSSLMSYVLYECKKEKVKLKNELDFLESYIQLEKMRFQDKTEIIFEQEVDFPEKEIAPLIFLPFVENAFKHIGSDNQKVPHVHFSLQMKTEQCIIFKSSNSVSMFGSQKRNPGHGIGINNISKQIAYLYPGKHVLNIQSQDNHYSVYLKIDFV